MVINLPGFKINCETEIEKYRADTFLTKEPETLAWIDDMEPGRVLYDVGANIGIYTLYAASRGIKVVAFEPQLENFYHLVKNIELNVFGNMITPFYAAIAGNAFRDFIDTSKISIVNISCGASGAQIGGNMGMIREVFSLSLECANSLSADKMDYLKVDVDGTENDVLSSFHMHHGPKSMLIEKNYDFTTDNKNLLDKYYTIDNKYNKMSPHSSERRRKEGINAENIIFTRVHIG